MSNTNRKSSPEDSDGLLDVRQAALTLLARREHSALELRRKLVRRGFAPALIDTLLAWLASKDLLNENRYAEAYCHARVERGYGPLRIRQDLRERGLPEAVVSAVLADYGGGWMRTLVEVHRKRFGTLPRNTVDRAKQRRFLCQRGFTSEQIGRLFRSS